MSSPLAVPKRCGPLALVPTEPWTPAASVTQRTVGLPALRYKGAVNGLDKRTTALYSAASIGTGAFFAFNNFVLPPILKSFGAPDLLTGLLSSTRSIEGVVIQPTVGAVSDRIWP